MESLLCSMGSTPAVILVLKLGVAVANMYRLLAWLRLTMVSSLSTVKEKYRRQTLVAQISDGEGARKAQDARKYIRRTRQKSTTADFGELIGMKWRSLTRTCRMHLADYY
ncbi:hypothetical protein EV421DRAFT_870248 [Armillaria borealis]|uniref:Uncharacterized protein n=1 Tax=Armillaria borealis TaxID=47425 RepID=A0AA39JBS2_9AGAR|nr:hypothetical protein EV421DRAFT_870248 [Armillaria borealis]